MMTATISSIPCVLLWGDFATPLSRGGVHFTIPLNLGKPELVLANNYMAEGMPCLLQAWSVTGLKLPFSVCWKSARML